MKPGDATPDFRLPNMDGEDTSLHDFKGKWVVLYFYPKDDTPGCTIEAIDFSALQKQFLKLGAVILGVSPDSSKSHCSFTEKHNLNITLLSDPQKEVLQKYKVWGKKKFMGREYLGLLRTTFLIDPKGKIAQIWENVNVKGHAQEVLDTLAKLSKK
ncbi:MAG TPA: thioredoxin-dependent thiol peroxidase [Candidatus Nanoarchaeia archaeon]|nr:thioredoxin-dependent thiol peroxidase [Candidatus Nanoarchaeia archaeon]